ncbi:ATP-binding protein [Tateyamaria sp. syn59]|uniref:sensor histidine kinase n=1 Tax=Tateyamaria sp. syn59 TaxID=2576942 RepID=UPI0011BEB1E2|nr:ATP-binding protein [Tateyamaria sp. syn59]
MTFVRRALRDRLGLRLVVMTLLVSTVFSAFAAGIQLYLSYQRQVGAAFQIVDRVSATSVDPLQNALWQFDFDQVDIILRGIQSDPAVAHVQLQSTTGHMFEYGDPEYTERRNEFDLVRDLNGLNEPIGTLTIYLSLDSIWADLWAQFFALVGTNLIKAYLVAFALLLLYYWTVTRHLTDVVRQVDASKSRATALDLTLDRSPRHRTDAIDRIVLALNDMSRRLTQQIDTLENEVSQRKKAERDAVAASMARKRFLANMSHEVRTPLNAMMGLFQLIEMSDVPERQKQQAATGLEAAQVLLAQLTNVLEVSRLEANAVKLHPKETNLAAIAQQWCDTANGSVKRYGKEIEVKVAVADDLPETVCMDNKRVSQIVHNLCDNAAKFTTSGTMLIDLRRGQHGEGHRGMIEISVSDTGPGLSPEDAGNVFERFLQVDDSLTRRYSGTGLGLSISSDLAKLMGGHLEVASPSHYLNYTTTFTLRIPTQDIEEAAA